jgi:hypothetical protein
MTLVQCGRQWAASGVGWATSMVGAATARGSLVLQLHSLYAEISRMPGGEELSRGTP